ncbi:MAG: ATP-binding cassette domain-containing protein, partial [Actinomycetota bacterium]
GEILGVAGVEGNGQFEVCQSILGLVESEGVVRLDGRDMAGQSTRERLSTGLSYIPFDRHDEGMMLEAPLWENLLLTRDDEDRFVKNGFVNQRAVRAATRTTIDRFDVKTPDETVPGYALSGGNQQKLLVGRELDSEPGVLIAAHPTRGVDVGAQATIWGNLRDARDAGLAVLLITADLEELIALSDRIVVMFDGYVTAELTPAEATPDVLGVHMTGGRVESIA